MTTYNLTSNQLGSSVSSFGLTSGQVNEAINIVTQLFESNLWPTGSHNLFTDVETTAGTYTLPGSGDLFLFDPSPAGGAAKVLDSKGGNILAGTGNIEYAGPSHGVHGDTLIGGDGAMSLKVDSGNNVLIGGTGLNTLYGGTGNDTMYGGGQSSLVAGSGNDVLRGGRLVGAHDTLVGGSGRDSLTSVVGNTLMVAGAGPTTLQGGSGSDTMYGGGHTLMFAGTGNDTLYAAGADSNAATLYGGVSGNIGARDTLNGGPGNDSLVGGSGSTTFYSGRGHSTLVGGAGSDTMYGGAHASMEAGTGNATLHGGYSAIAQTTMVGGSGNDHMGALLGNNTFYTGSGNDTIWTGSGHDTVFAGATGNATIYGGAKASLSIDNTNTFTTTKHGGMTTLTFSNGQVLTYGDHINIIKGP